MTLKIGANGPSAGVVFDYYDQNNFQFVTLVAATNQIVNGHDVKNSWVIDSVVTKAIAAKTDCTLSLR